MKGSIQFPPNTCRSCGIIILLVRIFLRLSWMFDGFVSGEGSFRLGGRLSHIAAWNNDHSSRNTNFSWNLGGIFTIRYRQMLVSRCVTWIFATVGEKPERAKKSKKVQTARSHTLAHARTPVAHPSHGIRTFLDFFLTFSTLSHKILIGGVFLDPKFPVSTIVGQTTFAD